ncbi:MAG: hypothetical protein KF906_00685 [Actinobacteria bacterium]|nr:hypothetical protein [Actinomycetota bacterium]
MCSRVECPTCHRPTFAGCGRHVEQVLGDVPRDQRCRCAEQTSAAPASAPRSGGLFGRLRSRT